jgi:serine/threonine protein kinase/phage shock protein PspC (stress-responsive transcriptional regulator)
MAMISWNEVAIVMVLATFTMVWVLVIMKVAVRLRTQPQPQMEPLVQKPAHQAAAAHWAEESLSVVSRLTQRFCPRCRAPLAADAPEGLCPACLMAGGLASAAAVEPSNGLAATTPPSGSQPPTTGEWSDLADRFPQFELLELLGRGGMGAVYKARQKNLDRLVALKVIPPEAAKDPTFAERFQREARAMARLNHANIVTVYDFGQVGDLYYLLMEYVDGVNLRHALRAARLAPTEALAIVPQICDALQYAHDQGVVHRDIKPENILLDRLGRVKIADFGLAKMLGQSPENFTLTGTQQVMGTPRYMAPEQIERPSTVDHRADIYSLGVVFYEMLTGELPIGRFEPPSQKVQVDVRIDNVVLRTLEKEPERRYQRASQVKTELSSQVQLPTWQTPEPSAKPNTGADPGVPVGPPIAIAAIMGVAGLFFVVFGFVSVAHANIDFRWFSSSWWSWIAGGSVCGLLGLGVWMAAYHVYRSATGAFNGFSPQRPMLEQMSDAVTAAGHCLRNLSRSKDDCWVGGVCGGLGEHTPIPAWCWRLLFIVLIFGYGVGVIAYIVMAICLPVGKEKPASPPSFGPAADWLRRLQRVSDDAWLGGVCGGLGRHTPIPSWCWRVVFLVLMFVYGAGFIPYILLWICLPGPPDPDDKPAQDQAAGGAAPADGRPNWHTPAPAIKSHSHQPKAPWSIAAVMATIALIGVIALAVCFALYFTRSAIQSSMVSAEFDDQASDAATKKHPTSGDFDRLLKSLRAESFDEGKLSFIKLVSRSNQFTAEQAQQLLKAFDYDPHRVQAAVILYPSVTDSKDFYLALESFDNDAGRISVRQELKLDQDSKPLAEEPGDRVSRKELQSLIRSAKHESTDTARVTFVRMIAHGRAFKCDQARELLTPFNFDPERENAAIAIFPRLSDPQNLYRTLEAFQFDHSRQSVRRRLNLE